METDLDDVEIAYEDMAWTGNEADGWTGTYTIMNQPLDEAVEVYTVTDPETALEGYQVESTPEVASDTATSSQDVTVAGGETAVTTFKAVLTSEADCTDGDPDCGLGGSTTADDTDPSENTGVTDDQTQDEDESKENSQDNPNGIGTPDTGVNQVIGTTNATTALAVAIAVAGAIALLVAMAPRIAGGRRARMAQRQEKRRHRK